MWHSRFLNTWPCCSCGTGCNCGSGSVPGLGISTCHGCSQKEKKFFFFTPNSLGKPQVTLSSFQYICTNNYIGRCFSCDGQEHLKANTAVTFSPGPLMPGELFSGKVKSDHMLKSVKGLLLGTGHPESQKRK